MQRSDREWAYVLSGQQYFILRKGGTEQPNTSPLYKEKRKGTFGCAACTAALFSSEAKFESGTGWPSFAVSGLARTVALSRRRLGSRRVVPLV